MCNAFPLISELKTIYYILITNGMKYLRAWLIDMLIIMTDRQAKPIFTISEY